MVNIQQAEPVRLIIGKKHYELRKSPQAGIRISRACGGIRGAMDGVNALDIERMAWVVVHGNEMPVTAFDGVAEALLGHGPLNAVSPMIEYLLIMAAGGVTVDGEPAQPGE